ncbi:MAG: PilX N-terminal domain-containing pilus assembly protein [Candidatus Electrothrix scaldis]|nr:MAG: PilX N-terminal domain-containing pilus assembly protein [Candidatus Electrothrix sp. GW3-3]
MKKEKKENEEGFVLVAALLILLVLTVMGISVNRNTSTEVKIALNDRVHKKTFYAADAATELATEVLVQSIACFGFDQLSTEEEKDDVEAGVRIPGAAGHDLYIEENALGFWRNYNTEGVPIPSDDEDGDGIPDRQMVYPAVFKEVGSNKVFDREKTNAQPHANISIGGNTKWVGGEATQQSDGYRGKGKGLGAGGVSLVYDINVQQIGQDGSESTVCVQYRHRPGTEGECSY